MGKNARSIRHVEKMREKRKAKAARAALYEAMGQRGDNSKRKTRRAAHGTKVGITRRDPNSKNIGDIISHPEMAFTVLRLYRAGQYTGRYKGWARDTAERIRTSPSSVWSRSDQHMLTEIPPVPVR